VKYHAFEISPVRRTDGQWLARFRRGDGSAVTINGTTLGQWTTNLHKTSEGALQQAMAIIDSLPKRKEPPSQ